MSDYLSFFGFDFFKAVRRKPAGNQQSPVPGRPANRADEDRIFDHEHPEVILWGMYPIY